MAGIAGKIEAAKEQVSSLKQQIEKIQKGNRDQLLGAAVKSAAAASSAAPTEAEPGAPAPAAVSYQPPAIRGPPATRVRRHLKGHFGKVTALHWGGDSRLLVSASQDGNLLVWNGVSANKIQSISLKSSYVMSVGIEQKYGNLVACGGLDNLCTVYQRSAPEKAMEMASHDGFLSCCRFLSEQEILTSSGDSNCIRWDIAAAKPISTFADHTADAMYLSLKPGGDKNVFVSCSVDQTAKVWDIRASESSVMTFQGFHTGDINCVEFMPSDGNCFATCSQDSSVRLFDLRAYNEVNKFSVPVVTAGMNADGGMGGVVGGEGGMGGEGGLGGVGGGGAGGLGAGGGGGGVGGAGGPGGAEFAPGDAGGMGRNVGGPDEVVDTFTSLAFSMSGRVIFCGHADGSVYAFDTLSDRNGPAFTLPAAHDRNVSCVGVSPLGNALCTGSWDGTLKIWA